MWPWTSPQTIRYWASAGPAAIDSGHSTLRRIGVCLEIMCLAPFPRRFLLASVRCISGFSGSAEYAALYAGQTNTQIVNSLYTNLFGREAEPAGLIHWSGRLTAGTETFASIALQLTYSAQGTDATAIANKLSASTTFTTALDTLRALHPAPG